MSFEIKSDEACQPLADRVMKAILSPGYSVMRKALDGCEMLITTGNAAIQGAFNPYYVSKQLMGAAAMTTDAQAMYKRDPEKIKSSLLFNESTGKYDAKITVDGLTRDSLNGPLVGAQALAPSAVSWYNQIFTRPLIWSNADKYAVTNVGTDPFAEVYSVQLLDFAGYANIVNSGSLSNEMGTAVESQASGQSSTIINISVSYKLTQTEQWRASSSSASPFVGQAIAKKQEYARWALDIAKKYLRIYGNASTGTLGLLTVNGSTAWSGAHGTLASIVAGASTTKGSDAYNDLALAVSNFLTTNQNMIDRLVIAMSVNSLNILKWLPYSATYNPKSTLEIMQENFKAGVGLAKGLEVEFYGDPLINAGPNEYNGGSHDYLLFLAPDIINGLDGERQPLIIAADPIPEMVMPVVPNGYVTEIKTFARTAGIFAPYNQCVQAYSAYGV